MQLPKDAPAWALAALAAFALLVQSVRLWWLGGRAARRVRAVAVRGAAGEDHAEVLLARHGYDVAARQAAQSWSFHVDGEEVPVTVRADFLVTRDGRRYVAEVKTGSAAPHARHPPTRRQLLEYRHAFDVDGVLLVHAEADLIQEVAFPTPRATSAAAPTPRLGLLLLALVIGAIAGASIALTLAPK